MRELKDPHFYTPHQLAKLWRCRATKIYTWIHRRELEAEDFSENPADGRPRWRISAKAAEEFRRGRRVTRVADSVRR